MFEEGRKYTCDRCKISVFHKWSMPPHGWSNKMGKDLCTNCTREFNEMVTAFFDEGPEEEQNERE